MIQLWRLDLYGSIDSLCRMVTVLVGMIEHLQGKLNLGSVGCLSPSLVGFGMANYGLAGSPAQCTDPGHGFQLWMLDLYGSAGGWRPGHLVAYMIMLE